MTNIYNNLYGIIQKEDKNWVVHKIRLHNFEVIFKHIIMEGLSIIEGQILRKWEQRLSGIEQNQLAIMKLTERLLPPLVQSSVPDFILISDASKKYHISKVTINSKINLFKLNFKREIDRLQAGKFYLINKYELQLAIKLKSDIDLNFCNES